MKSLARLATWVIFFMGAQASAQGFAGFPGVPVDSNATMNLSLRNPAAMFDRYLAEQFATDIDRLGPKAVIILIPQDGCAFCAGHTIQFYQAHHDAIPSIRLVMAGQSNYEREYNLKPADMLSDSKSACNLYGFEYAFPLIALLNEKKTTELIQIESQKIHEQLAAIMAFMQESSVEEDR